MIVLEYVQYNDYEDLTKKYLRKYNTFKLTAKALEEDINTKEQILASSLDVSAAIAKYGDMPAGGNSELNEVEAACERRLKVQEEIKNMKNDLAEINRLLEKIDMAFEVTDGTVSKMIEDYYKYGYSWEQISVRQHYSPRWCREKVKKAVKDMSVVIFGIKAWPQQQSLIFAR